MLEGGCACGAVRYRLTAEPYNAGYCHCSICRRSAGAPVLAFATVPLKNFELVQGVPRRWQSTSFGERGFCGDCGTQLTIHIEQQPEEIDIAVATLDMPELVPPRFHIWHSRRIAWFETADDFPRYAENRPGAFKP